MSVLLTGVLTSCPTPPATTGSSSTPTARSIYISNLNPIKRKLDRIETERVFRVIQRCARKIGQLKLLSWFIEDDSRLFRITDEELRRLVLNHQQLSKSSMNDDVDLLKASTRAILRYCAVNSVQLSSYSGNAKVNLLSPHPVENLREYSEELKEIMHEKLLSESSEEKTHWKYLLQSMEKSRVALDACQQLRLSLKQCAGVKDQVISVKDAEILELRQSLETIQQTTEEENNNSLNEAAKQILTNQKSLSTKSKKLNQDRFQYSDNFVKANALNYEKESKLRKRKFKMAGELQNWILKYDQDMGWRQDEIDQLHELNKKDLEDLEELERHFEEMSKEYAAIMEEKKLIAEEKERQENELRELKHATVKIQAMWRGYETRKSLSQPPPKGGKKGAKKAAGGGKKKK